MTGTRRMTMGALLAALALTTSGCGDEEPEDAAARPDRPAWIEAGIVAETPEERTLLRLVRRYHAAYQTGDAREVRRMRTSLCRMLSYEESLDATMREVRKSGAEASEVTAFTVRRPDRRTAFVSVGFADRSLDSRNEVWSFEDGRWGSGDC